MAQSEPLIAPSQPTPAARTGLDSPGAGVPPSVTVDTPEPGERIAIEITSRIALRIAVDFTDAHAAVVDGTIEVTLPNGSVLVLYGLSQTLWLSALVLVMWGLVAAVFINYAVVLLQEHTDPRMMGRVMSMYMLAFFLSSPIGYAQAGAVTSAFGPQVTLVASGLVAAVIGLVSLAFARPVRALA